MEWRERDGVRWLEADLGGARAAFTTRLGGASKPPFDSLNLGILPDDDQAAVQQNRDRLAAALGFAPEQVLFALQVHGTRLIDGSAPSGQFRGSFVGPGTTKEPRNELPAADGHLVREPGSAPLVFVADCLPVALYGPRGLAIVHAGWRGLAGRLRPAAARGVEDTQRARGAPVRACPYP